MRFYRTLKTGERIALLIFLLCVGSSFVRCQTQQKKLHSQEHKDTIEQQEEIRFMFITVTAKEDNKIIFYRQGAKLIEASFLFIDKQTVLKDPAAKTFQFTGCFGALICLKHAYIYWLQRMPCTDNTGSFYFSDH